MSPRFVLTLAALVVAVGGAIVVVSKETLHPGPLTAPETAAITQSPSIAPVADPQNPKQADRELRWFRELNLSADQMQRIRSIRAQYKDQITQQKRSVRQLQQELRELMVGNTPASEVQKKFDQLQSQRQQLAALQFKSMLATRDVLTLEQRRTFADHMLRHRDGMKGPGENPKVRTESY